MKVSVCIPVYKAEKLIERCARSLFEQTLKDGIEFIFVDDCSPDESIDVVKRVLEEYPERQTQVKFLRNATNSGQTLSRMAAFEAAQGDYVICCDSDDWVDKDLYAQMLAKAEAEKLDIVYCPVSCWIDDRQVRRSVVRAESVPQLFGDWFCREGFNVVWNKLVAAPIAKRRQKILMDKPGVGEDLIMVLQWLAQAHRVGFVDSAAYHYVQVRNLKSMSKQYAFSEVEWRIQAVESLIGRDYPECVSHYKHCHLLEVIKHRAVGRRTYRKLWPDVNNFRSILSDKLLSKPRKFALCGARLFWWPTCVLTAFLKRLMP